MGSAPGNVVFAWAIKENLERRANGNAKILFVKESFKNGLREVVAE